MVEDSAEILESAGKVKQSGSVDYIASAGYGVHLVEGGGVLSLEMGQGDFARLGVQAGIYCFDNRGLAYAGFAAEQNDLVFAELS